MKTLTFTEKKEALEKARLAVLQLAGMVALSGNAELYNELLTKIDDVIEVVFCDYDLMTGNTLIESIPMAAPLAAELQTPGLAEELEAQS